MTDWDAMSAAMKLAAEDPLEVPVGAVIVHRGVIVSGAHNQQAARRDPLAHAEMLAIKDALAILGRDRLQECSMFVTLEPCPMCAGAVILARMRRCVFGAFDHQYGCCGSVYFLPMDPVFHHQIPCQGGLMEKDSKALLDGFFQRLREEERLTRPEEPFKGL